MDWCLIVEDDANVAVTYLRFSLCIRWTGVIGALVEDDADIGVTYFFVTEARSQVVEFSPAITEGILR